MSRTAFLIKATGEAHPLHGNNARLLQLSRFSVSSDEQDRIGRVLEARVKGFGKAIDFSVYQKNKCRGDCDLPLW